MSEAIPTMSAPARKRILILDDHPIVRRGLCELIHGEPDLELCPEPLESGDVLQLIASEKPDLVLIDISLRNGSGIELIKDIKARDLPVKMLVFSMHDESLFAERVLRAGAMGYVHKEAAVETIVDAIRQVLTGKVYLSEKMTDRVLQRATGNGHVAESPVERLTDRELEVFGLIGQGQTTRQIAGTLHLSVKTIETHREHIKEKLKLVNGTELTRYAVEWAIECCGGV